MLCFDVMCIKISFLPVDWQQVIHCFSGCGLKPRDIPSVCNEILNTTSLPLPLVCLLLFTIKHLRILLFFPFSQPWKKLVLGPERVHWSGTSCCCAWRSWNLGCQPQCHDSVHHSTQHQVALHCPCPWLHPALPVLGWSSWAQHPGHRTGRERHDATECLPWNIWVSERYLCGLDQWEYILEWCTLQLDRNDFSPIGVKQPDEANCDFRVGRTRSCLSASWKRVGYHRSQFGCPWEFWFDRRWDNIASYLQFMSARVRDSPLLCRIHHRSNACHYHSRFLFWSDAGRNPKIERSSLLGSYRTTIVQELVRPMFLSLDFHLDRLFWLETPTSTINSVSLNGQQRRLEIQLKGGEYGGMSLTKVSDTLHA